jgi:carbamoyl-phosphate synthase small subunit
MIKKLPYLRCETGLRARLLFEDEDAVEGCGFGAKDVRVGEIVFSTGMTGYTEALTDPSYAGQILIWTHPMTGCYGVPSENHSYCGVPLNYESDHIHVNGFIIAELTPYGHHLSNFDLHTWLVKNNVPGMYKVDTRALVKKIREKGVMMGILAVFDEKEEIEWSVLKKKLEENKRYDTENFVAKVSPDKIIIHEPMSKPVATISVLDCGLKYGILRWLLKQGFKVVRFPCWARSDELLDGFQGVVISNGPGNPAILTDQIKTVREIIDTGIPVLGICLGMQLLSLALGAKIYKLRYGHRGPNKGVIELTTGRSYVTTQNHGYAVDEKSLSETELMLWFKNIDDKSVEGVIHRRLPVIATQFHPEGGPGPHDTTWIFELFKRMVLNNGRR